MRKGIFTILIIFIFLLSSCSPLPRNTSGSVSADEFYVTVPFTTIKGAILVECDIDGRIRNFLFDTGADYTLIQRESIKGKTVTVRGASKRTEQNGTEVVESFKIGDLEFQNIPATNANIPYLRDTIPNYGGILGRSVFNKANWLIDYPNRTLTISNQDLSKHDFLRISRENVHDAPYTNLTIDGNTYKAIIDLGSTSTLNVPETHPLAKHLLENYTTKTNQRIRYTVGGPQSIEELVGNLPEMGVEQAKFTNVDFNINVSSQVRVGIGLFKESIFYIDGKTNEYKVRQVR